MRPGGAATAPIIELAGVQKAYRTGRLEFPGAAGRGPGDRSG